MRLATEIAKSLRISTVSFSSGCSVLVGEIFLPKKEPDTVVILNGATGVPARFYRDFARWLTLEIGVACLIYDYRDFGASLQGSMRHSGATMADWAVFDQEAARNFVRVKFPDSKIWLIGHSVGAMCIPFQRNLNEIDRVISIASGRVHVSDHPWPFQAFARLFWFGPIPLITSCAGYLPGRRLKLGSDLPRNVYWQWRRWCTERSYFAKDIGTHLPDPDWYGLRAPVKIIAIDDDFMMPPNTVWRSTEWFCAAQRSTLLLKPSDYGLEKIGHLNVLSKNCSAVWSEIVG